MIEYFALLYFFLPAYLANSFPVFAAKLFPQWKAPIDAGYKLRKKPLFGKNKTWRGLILGTLLAGLFFCLQKYYLPVLGIPYETLPWWFGFLLGFSALFGDLVESFVKRQLGHKSGELWFPWDKIDFVLGAFALTFWLFWPGWWAFLFLLILSAVLSEVAHITGYCLGLCKNKR